MFDSKLSNHRDVENRTVDRMDRRVMKTTIAIGVLNMSIVVLYMSNVVKSYGIYEARIKRKIRWAFEKLFE